MLPSRGKFHTSTCPFFLLGECERPFCHFKHSLSPDRTDDRSSDSKNGNSANCTTNNCECKSSEYLAKRARILAASSKDDGSKTKFAYQPPKNIPEYRPTPIAELQKRTHPGTKNKEESVGHAGYSVSENDHQYSPKSNEDSPILCSYKPSEISTLRPKKQEYKPLGYADSKLLDYEPSKNLWNAKEPSYEPEGATISLDYSPSDKLFSDKQEPEYQPSVEKGSSDFHSKSSNCDNSKSSPKYSTSSSQENKTSLKYIPTDKSKLESPKSKDAKSSSSKTKSSSSSRSSSTHKKSSSGSDKRKSDEKKNTEKESSSKKRNLESGESSESKRVCKDDSKSHSSKSKDSKSSSKNNNSSSHKSSRSSSSHKSSTKSSSSHKSSSESTHRSKSHKSSKSSSHKDTSKESSKRSSSKDKSKHSSSHKRTSSTSKESSDSSKKTSKSKEKTKSGEVTEMEDSISREIEKAATPSPCSSDDSREDVMEECYRIFEKYEMEGLEAAVRDAQMDSVQRSPDAPSLEKEDTVTTVMGKKRIAHDSTVTRVPQRKPKASNIRPVSSAIGCSLVERWKAQQAAHLQETNQGHLGGAASVLSQLTDTPASSKAPMPWLQKPSAESSTSRDKPKTIAQTVTKGRGRVAHKASEVILQRPLVNASPGDKIPGSKRQISLDRLVDAALKVYDTTEDAYEKAVELESDCFERGKTITVYNSFVTSQLLKLRRSSQASSGEVSTLRPNCSITSHADVLGALSKGLVCKKTVQRNYDFRGEELYRRLERYVLSPKQLKELGFPMVHPSGVPGRAEIQTDRKKEPLPNPLERECMRCGTKYSVDKLGMPKLLREPCIFHSKKPFRKKVRDGFDLYYDCCGQHISSEGCESNNYHVSENVDYEALFGYQETIPHTRNGVEVAAESSGVYALDCEMCYTTEGAEVTRVTVVDADGKNVYDQLIKPSRPILDYNTQFSGITEEKLRHVTANLPYVQSVLMSKFNHNTILIGHSLNGDLQVLKLIHKTVIDTSVVFPHKEGLPKRRALRNLAKDYLFRLIQQSEDGHDSKEDALACMDLMLLKVKEDAKLE